MEWKIIEPILTPEQMGGKCRLYAKVSILPGHALEAHEHHGESESYYILSGQGIYEDDGVKMPAKPGDSFLCLDGHSHGIACVGDEPVVFIALIVNG